MDFIIPHSDLKPQVHFYSPGVIKHKPRKATYWRHQHRNCSNKNFMTIIWIKTAKTNCFEF